MSVEKSLQTAPTLNQMPQAGNPPVGTVTSSFFVAMDALFIKGNVTGGTVTTASKKLDHAVQLLWFTSIEQRVSIGTMTSDFQASATLVHSLLELHIMTDSAMPGLREALRNNTPIATIWVIRVGHLGEGKENTELYSSKFTNCFLESIEEFPDKLILKARVTGRIDKAAVTGFDLTTMQKAPSGSAASGWDYMFNAPAKP